MLVPTMPVKLAPRPLAPSSGGGTGSYPLPPNGWQRPIRRSVNHVARRGLCVRYASSAYSEHEGWNRQCPPMNGPSSAWYNRIRRMNGSAAGEDDSGRIFCLPPPLAPLELGVKLPREIEQQPLVLRQSQRLRGLGADHKVVRPPVAPRQLALGESKRLTQEPL